MSKNNTIYYITLDDLKNEDIVFNHIYLDKNSNYYYSDDFSCEFYIYLASFGFISTTAVFEDTLYLLPELQYEYAILDFEDLHISKKVKKLITQNNYIFSIDTHLEDILKNLDTYHNPNWLVEEYQELIKDLSLIKNSKFQIRTFSIIDKESNKVIAAEIGYTIGKTYTSLTGFALKEKKYNNYGKLQLVLLAQYLKKEDYDFWNLGHPYMQYKFDLGAKQYSREDFLSRWHKSIIK